MRYMILVKANAESEAGVMPTEELAAEMATFIIKVKDEQEARDWTRRFPNPTLGGTDCHIEVRRVYELEDFGALESIQRFRDIPGNGRPAV